MARILVTSDETWYDELSVIASYYESEFERIIKQHVHNVFPDYITISYKMQIIADNKEPKIPDLAMIRKNYSDWWIVEVELSNHTLDHVLEQVEVFSNGNFNPYIVSEYILNKIEEESQESLDREKLITMIKNIQPNVLVIVDEPIEEWEKELIKYNAKLCIFQVYRNVKSHDAYRLDGKYPIVAHKESYCKYHKRIANLLEILNPKIFDEIEEDIIDVNYNGKVSRWKKIILKNATYLRAIVRINPIPPNRTYILFQDANNRFLLKII